MPRLCFHAGHGHAVEPPSLSLSRLRSDNGQDSALYCIVLYFIVLYWFEAAPPAAADKGFARFGLIFQLNGGRALRGTLVAVVRSTLKQVGHDE